MSAIPGVQVTHESETQRQHVRFAIPARAVVGSKEYEVKDLSPGGVALRGVNGQVPIGKIVRLELKLPFEGFSFTLPLEAEVRHYVSGKGVLGARFVNLSPHHVSFLTHFIKSFIAGDVVNAGSILNVAARSNFTKAPSAANKNAPPAGLRRQLPGLFAVAVLGLLIATFIGQSLFNSLFVVQADTAAVGGPAVPLRASEAGVFRSKLDSDTPFVKQNQPVGTIVQPGGATVNVVSPCDCYISRTDTASGESVAAGGAILSLIPVDAKLWVTADIDPSLGKRIGTSTLATVNIFGSRTVYTGHVASMELSPATSATAERHAVAKVALDQKLPMDYVNRLATVTFAIH